MIGLYAGSFSVPTMGHMDIICAAAAVNGSSSPYW